jgi:tetratricopeptide (TPR) repeat protein
VLLVFVRSLGAPFGEPVADDFDHLHHALFAHDGSWLNGGGSTSFWRPLAYQGYYGLLHGVILTHPAWITALHLALCALCAWLLYDTARRHLPGPAAAVVASFPLLLESARALVLVPVHFVDLGLLVFSVVAWRLAEAGRLVPALIALLAALLCKETAVATALALPWLARIPPGGSRRPWLVATGVLTVAWAVAYLMVRRSLAMALPHGLEAHLSPHLFLEPARYAWAIAGTLRALVSLPMLAGPREGIVLAAALLVLGAALVQFATGPAARARFSRERGWVLAGLAWFVLATGTLLSVYPVWSPERVVYASLGLGAALTVTLWAAHPALPWALVVLRLVTFLLAPGAPARVTRDPPERGAFVDFERLARLQRLMLEARTTLQQEFPRLPRGAGVAMLHPPFMTDYAGGDRALQVWYRDSTLRWLHWEQMADAEAQSLSGALEFQEGTTPQFRRIEPDALRLLFVAGKLDRSENWQASLDSLRRADQIQKDRSANHFLGRVYGLEAWCLGALGHLPEAERTARQSLAISTENADGHLTLAALYNGRNEWTQSLAQLDTLLYWYPNYQAAVMMRQGVVERMRAQGLVPAAPAPPRP